MPSVLTEVLAPVRAPKPKTWSRSEYWAFDQLRMLEGRKYELVEGELVDKMGKNFIHVFLTHAIVIALARIFGEDRVYQEAPIDVAPGDNERSEPEPDVIVLKSPPRLRNSGNLQASDLWLAVEVSDTTLAFDRSTKASLYARAGIVEYWILDATGRSLIVHRDPTEGTYRSVVSYDETETIEPIGSPGKQFRLAGIFGEN